MKPPYLPKAPIRAELHGFENECWVVGVGENPPNSKDRLFAIILPTSGNYPPYVKLNSFKNSSPELQEFIKEAEEYFKPLIKLDMTTSQLFQIQLEFEKGTNSLIYYLKKHGFELKG